MNYDKKVERIYFIDLSIFIPNMAEEIIIPYKKDFISRDVMRIKLKIAFQYQPRSLKSPYRIMSIICKRVDFPQ